MKKLYLAIFSFLLSGYLYAAPVITAVLNNGSWTSSSTWDLGRQPKNGDTIVIPSGITVSLSNTFKSYSNIIIEIKGALKLQNARIKMNNGSVVEIALGGVLNGTGSTSWLKIGSKIKYRGTQGNQAGPGYADMNTGTYPNGFLSFTTLPVQFTSFTALKQTDRVTLSWSTGFERNNSHFEVEKSTDGRQWKVLAIILPAGSSQGGHYQYTDRQIKALAYYRIRQVDTDGQVLYSSIRIIRSQAETPAARIYASSRHSVAIDLNREISGPITVSLFTLNGQVLAREVFDRASYRINLQVNQNLSGLYVVQLTDNTHWRESGKILF